MPPVKPIKPSKSTPHPVAAGMARAMAEFTALRGACTEDDLLLSGYTREEIARHADAARAHAGRMANARHLGTAA